MSAGSGLAESQLLELLEQLKKTTPEAAKQILNSQPSIAYALITMMVNMGAVKTEVFQRILAAYGAQQAQAQAQAITPSQTPHRGTPQPTLQPPQAYAMQGHAPTDPRGYNAGYGTPTAPGGYGTPTAPAGYGTPTAPGGYGTPTGPGGYNTPTGPAGYNHAPPAQGHQGYPQRAPALPDALGGIPEEQKAMIMRVLQMTPEQINALPPAERGSIMQLRAAMGVS